MGNLIRKTEATDEKMRAVVKEIAPFMKDEDQVFRLAQAIAEFTNQAIRDDRVHTMSVLARYEGALEQYDKQPPEFMAGYREATRLVTETHEGKL